MENVKILIVTGETSGDLHGANLARAVHQLNPAVRIQGMGGERMREAGVELVQDIEHLDAIGMVGFRQLVAAIRAYRTIRHLLQTESFAAVVFIDNPGLNLRLARVAARAGQRVIYYIAPQIWAWRRGRIHLIKRVVDRMLVTLPFEEALYKEAGVPCTFVGHPLLDDMCLPADKQQSREQLGFAPQALVLGLLPGSRDKEVRLLLPVMLLAAARLALSHHLECVVALSTSLSKTVVNDILAQTLPARRMSVHVIRGRANDVMASADLLFVASGTATLQAAIIGTPMVITYRVSWLTFQLAKRLVQIDSIGLVNIIAEHQLVPELIQDQATPDRLCQEGARLLTDQARSDHMRAGFTKVRDAIGEPGASRRAASHVLEECRA